VHEGEVHEGECVCVCVGGGERERGGVQKTVRDINPALLSYCPGAAVWD
jgi:hypothetical protein